MLASALLALWLGCSGAPTPEAPPSPAPASPLSPEAAWPYAWNVAAVVLVGEPGAESVRLDGAGVELSLEEVVLRDALAGTPVELWRAAPGASLRIEPRRPGWSLDVLAIDLPPDVEPGSRIVQTDQGRHRLVWPLTSRAREVQVALGLAPWRAVVAVGQPLPAELAQGPMAERLTEAGVGRRQVEAGQTVALPWEDLGLERFDPGPYLEGGKGLLLLEKGRPPWRVRDEARWSEEAATWFQVRLAPMRRGGPEGERAAGERGPGERGPEGTRAGPGGRPERGARPGMRGPMGPGKAGKRPGVSGSGAAGGGR